MRLSQWLEQAIFSYYTELKISSTASNIEISEACSKLIEKASDEETFLKIKIDQFQIKIDQENEEIKDKNVFISEYASLSKHVLTERLETLKSRLKTCVWQQPHFEFIMITLLDPEKRAEYDIQIQQEREKKLDELNQEWMKYLGGQIPEFLYVLISTHELKVLQPLSKELLAEKVSSVLSAYFVNPMNGRQWGDLIMTSEDRARQLLSRGPLRGIRIMSDHANLNPETSGVEAGLMVKIKYRDPRHIDENTLKVEEILAVVTKSGFDISGALEVKMREGAGDRFRPGF